MKSLFISLVILFMGVDDNKNIQIPNCIEIQIDREIICGQVVPYCWQGECSVVLYIPSKGLFYDR